MRYVIMLLAGLGILVALGCGADCGEIINACTASPDSGALPDQRGPMVDSGVLQDTGVVDVGSPDATPPCGEQCSRMCLGVDAGPDAGLTCFEDCLRNCGGG